MSQVQVYQVAGDASSYVRACGEPEALGYHPSWIMLILIAIFLNFWLIQLLCVLGIGFIIYAKQQNATLFDMVRRFRRWTVGNSRKPFRSRS
ncbi:hypothetical protein [Pseudomonas sp. GXZC]|uniref:hypothetical protein n=1 Tax=Pseudomonas sp. GXZC TaxID=3003351 RepID=UPI0022AA594D|nr:hypothetical protein [Pseudomonas sp. GXZC]WAT32083.1 hypothetical protein OZ428_34040 [Pseudomonas sp. GXZC]